MDIHSRWLALAVALLLESAAGVVYAFSLYSSDIQTHFNISQGETDLVGTAGNWGGSFGVHIGFLYALFGPRTTILLACILGVPCWVLMWSSLSGALLLPYWSLLVIAFLQGHSQMILDCTAVPTVIAHFPDHRGRASGLSKALVGLSGSLAAMVYKAGACLACWSLHIHILKPLASAA